MGLAMVALVLAVVASAVVWFFASGHRAYVVHTGSMSPTYKPGSLVIDRPAKGDYRAGEVITFRHSPYTDDVVTHRITDVTKAGLIHTKGDGNGTPDVWDIRPDQVRGTVMTGVPLAGYVVVYLQQPAGIGSVVVAAFALIMLWGLSFPPTEDEPVRVSRLRVLRAHRAASRGATESLVVAANQ
jgi:signal peptidase